MSFQLNYEEYLFLKWSYCIYIHQMKREKVRSAVCLLLVFNVEGIQLKCDLLGTKQLDI